MTVFFPVSDRNGNPLGLVRIGVTLLPHDPHAVAVYGVDLTVQPDVEEESAGPSMRAVRSSLPFTASPLLAGRVEFNVQEEEHGGPATHITHIQGRSDGLAFGLAAAEEALSEYYRSEIGLLRPSERSYLHRQPLWPLIVATGAVRPSIATGLPAMVAAVSNMEAKARVVLDAAAARGRQAPVPPWFMYPAEHREDDRVTACTAKQLEEAGVTLYPVRTMVEACALLVDYLLDHVLQPQIHDVAREIARRTEQRRARWRQRKVPTR